MHGADLKEKQFDILFATLGDLQSGLMSSTTQVAGFFLVAIGWLTTSDKASALLKEHANGRYLAALSLAGAYGLYVFGVFLVYRRSQRISRLLQQIDLVPPQTYASRVLDLSELFVFVGGTFFLFALAIKLLL